MKTTDSKTQKILDAYFADNAELDERTVRIIQGWLEDKLNRGEADRGLRGVFNRTMGKQRPEIDRYTRESLARLHEELHFEDRNIPLVLTPLQRSRSKNRRLMRLALVGMAAAAILAVAFLIPGLFRTPIEPTVPTMVAMSAATHEIKEVVLPDGSTARLKAGTHITFADQFEQNRAVTIDGEAFFIVKRDENHPFTVEAKEMRVTVLGTAFNVKAWSGAETSEVVVANGSVEVRSGESTEVLEPHEMATVDRAADRIDVTIVEQADILRVRGINLSFDKVPLDRAFEMIADYYGVSVKAAGDVPEVKSIVVKLDDGATLEKTLWFLQQVVPVFDYTIADGKVTIRKK